MQGIDEEPAKIQRPGPERLRGLCWEIQRLSKPENIWMRARDVHQKDIALEGERAVWTLGALFSLIVIAPIVVAIFTHALSPWSLSIEATVLALATWLAIIEEDLKSGLFLLVVTHGYATMVFRWVFNNLSAGERRYKASYKAISIGMACAATALIVINIYSVSQLKGWWWICAYPLALTITCNLESDDKVSVWRRSNPLATARDSLESEQRRTGWQNILSNR